MNSVAGCSVPQVVKFPEPPPRMGQRTSAHLRPKISLTWVLRGQQHPVDSDPNIFGKNGLRSSRNHLKPNDTMKTGDFTRNGIEKFEMSLESERVASRQLENFLKCKNKEATKEKMKRAISEPSLVLRESTTPSVHEKHRHRRARRTHKTRRNSRFGYEINDLDLFLTKASIEKPANIPVVISFTSMLYQTQGGIQDEIALPLGTVVNAVFKNQAWLYVQTPHGQEGYVGYSACLPLGILPQPTRGPCWENTNDVFPRPLGNMTDTEKLRDVRSECGVRTSRRRRGSRTTVSACGERSVDRLYLRAAANAKKAGPRQTLLIIHNDYTPHEKDSIAVSKGDVVALLSDSTQDWFWVRSRDGREGFIPAVVAGHGFL